MCRQVKLTASEPVWVRAGSDVTPHAVRLPSAGVMVQFSGGSWRIGGVTMGEGELTLTPEAAGGAQIEGRRYRGRYRLVPVTADSFDVVNDLDIDGYLKGVVSVELYSSWEDQAYMAQSIAARTYAIYEARTSGAGRYWDLYADERSQAYRGMESETAKSIRTVDATAGLVVAQGPAGGERIFKSYYSSCCGGKTQSAYDAFGDDYTRALSEEERGGTCSISPRFSWGPIVISKQEIARRISVWAKRRSEQQGALVPETRMQGVDRIDLAYLNKLDRPVLFYVTDTAGQRFMMRAEDLRTAINTDAAAGSILYSGFFKPVNDRDVIRFTEGHGYGHGVGMCQWCAQRLALMGWDHKRIVLWSYPGAKLIRAY